MEIEVSSCDVGQTIENASMEKFEVAHLGVKRVILLSIGHISFFGGGPEEKASNKVAVDGHDD